LMSFELEAAHSHIHGAGLPFRVIIPRTNPPL
jgi:hypothetical protein